MNSFSLQAETRRSHSGFSLVEVAIAIGILSFCLIAILGLFPTGMQVMSRTTEEARGMQTLAALAASIRSASSTNQVDYTAAAPFTNLTWQVGGSRIDQTFYVTEEAQVANSAGDPGVRQSIFLSLVPPVGNFSPGTAYVGVAWPAAAAVTAWQAPAATDQAAAPTLSKEKGYVSTTVIFGGKE